jgi:hypothetical protein
MSDEIGLRRINSMRPLTEKEIQDGIMRTMREVVTQDTRNPQQLRRPETATPANAPVVKTFGEGRGFIEDKPLEQPFKPGSLEERVVSRMIDEVLPPGVEKKARK